MDNGTTIKDILRERLKEKETTPLYNQEALDRLGRVFEGWKQDCVKPRDQESWSSLHRTVLGSDTPREMLYSPLSNPNFDYERDLGNSGAEPYTRGVHANMYRGRNLYQAPARRFRRARGNQRAHQVSARPRRHGHQHHFRSSHHSDVRFRRPRIRGSGGHVRRGHRYRRRHGSPVQGHPAG